MGKLHSEDLPAGVRSKVAKTSKSITKKASGEFAAKVEENDDIDFSVLSFKEYIMVESVLVEAFSELTDDEVDELTETANDFEDAMKMFSAKGGKIKTAPMAKPRKGEHLGGSKHLAGRGEVGRGKPSHGSSAAALSSKVIGLSNIKEEAVSSKKASKDEEYANKMAAERYARKIKAARETNAKNSPSKPITEKWAKPFEVPKSRRGMFAGMSTAELESKLSTLKKSGPHHEGSPEFTKEKELNFALRSKNNWKSA
jgi:hypothetical protein